jgi:hypothetical protein
LAHALRGFLFTPETVKRCESSSRAGGLPKSQLRDCGNGRLWKENGGAFKSNLGTGQLRQKQICDLTMDGCIHPSIETINRSSAHFIFSKK